MNKILRLNNLKSTAAMNAKISGFVIYVEAIIYLLLGGIHKVRTQLGGGSIKSVQVRTSGGGGDV